MNKPNKWDDYLHLVEFAYNNSYQSSLKMSPFQALNGRRCNTTVSWDSPMNITMLGPKRVKEMEQNISRIKQNLETNQDRQKIYILKNKMHKELKVGEHVYLKVKP
jgi:hypothetical protein